MTPCATSPFPCRRCSDLLSAFRQDVVKTRDGAGYADRAELLDYCSRSANPVGRLLLHLYGVGDAEALARSDDICTALQLANFWQDLSVDLPRGRFYLPASDCREHGLDPLAPPAGRPTRGPGNWWQPGAVGARPDARGRAAGAPGARAARAGNCDWWCRAGCASWTGSRRSASTVFASGPGSAPVTCRCCCGAPCGCDNPGMNAEQYVQEKAVASGSSFYYAFLFLPKPRRAAITAFYAFCREVDDVVDEVTDPGVAHTKLAWWQAEVAQVVRRHSPATR